MTEDCFNICTNQASLLPHSRMCLSTFSPGISRIRHWSCPERLSNSLDETFSDELLPKYKSDDMLMKRSSMWQGNVGDVVLAAWEERVLSLREARRNKHRSEPIHFSMDNSPSSPPDVSSPRLSSFPSNAMKTDYIHDDSENFDTMSSLKLGVTICENTLNDRLLEPTIELSDTGTSSIIRDQTLIKMNCELTTDEPSLIEVEPSPPDTGPETDKRLLVTSDDSSANDTWNDVTNLILDQSCQSTQKCSYILSNMHSFLKFLVFLPIFKLSASLLPNTERSETRVKYQKNVRKKRRNSLGVQSCILLVMLSVFLPSGLCFEMEGKQFLIEDNSPDEPVCQDGIFRGNININNRDESTSLAGLKRYENCSVIEGSFSITSAIYPIEDFGNYSMPNLVEITDYLLLYRADEIDSLEKLFPKLAVIRGHKLVQFYALAIYQMKNMVRVGLPSLTHIMNGGVRIEKNPLLCYVDTVEWEEIVVRDTDKKSHIQIIDNQEPNSCLDKCPEKCTDGCWSSVDCQSVVVPCPSGTEHEHERMCYRNNKGEEGRPCHKECIGGCEDVEDDVNNPDKCVACNHTRYMSNSDDPLAFTCLARCPSNMVLYKQWMCITEEDCSNRKVFGGNMFITENHAKSYFKVDQNRCVEICPKGHKPIKKGNIWRCEKCGDASDCPVNCDGEIINSQESAEKLNQCTHISGDLVINVNKGDITQYLETNLQYIEEIGGSLKIERSHSLVSLHFFKNLKKIGGNGDTTKILTIFENDNLQKLFPENRTISLGSNGHVFIHYNQKLCKKEIVQFLKKSGINHVEEQSVSSYSNGNKIVCSEEKLELRVKTGGPDLLRLEFKNYYQTLEQMHNVDVNSLLGYHVYYREVNEKQYQEQSITKYEGMSACEGSAWNVIFEDDPAKFTSYNGSTTPCDNCMELNGLYVEIKYNNPWTYIPNCKPYTPYAIYVTTVMEKALAGNATGAQSDIVYARTSETNPSPVTKLTATSPSPDSLDVSWGPPSKPNGIVDRYILEISYLKSNDDAEERDYCTQSKKEPSKQPEPAKPPVIDDTDICHTCQCPSSDEAGTLPVAPDSEIVIGEKSFHDDIINKVFPLIQSVSLTEDDPLLHLHDPFSRKKRSVSDSKSSNSVTDAPEDVENVSYIHIQSQRNGPIKKLSEANSTIPGTNHMSRILLSLPGNVTNIKVDQLKHFTDYEIRVFACHALKTDNKGTYRACSDEAILNRKTRYNQDADDIVPWNLDYELYTLAGNGSEGIIKWFPPSDPNERIVKYMLSWSPDASTGIYTKCIKLSEISKSHEKVNGTLREVMTYRLTHSGEYYIRLQAVSLFGEGSWTKFQFVRVNSNKNQVVTIVIVGLFLLLALAMVMFGAYAWYRKKTLQVPGWTVSSTNENYMNSSDIYIVDDWEVKRENIKIMEELGKGSFGLVYRGLYTDPEKGDMSVAVKTVNKESTYKQKMEFLQEASVMKDYNTEHVIKLIGVVSQGQPALVLMELMENGDLKNYLRSLRPDSENNRLQLPAPTIGEVLQMAIEIADGMAYLSVKKIVHRDLAARNCMVSNNVVVKVGDFGMARDVYETEYYKKQGRGLLPVRWMAPESIRDGKFTSQSDVWSFGVVLWEMATLAEQPYQGFTNEEVMKYVKEGNKMMRPDNCPDILFELMSECWHIIPDERPTFLQICKRLLDKANDRWRETCYFLTPEGKEAMSNHEEMLQIRREREEASNSDARTPLTTDNQEQNGGSGDNGHLPKPSGESHPLVNLRPNARSPTHVYFSNESSGYGSGNRSGSRGRISMNGIVQRFRNMSGSTSGEA